jgi:hypothetical protein
MSVIFIFRATSLTMTSKMALQTGANDSKLRWYLLTPSWSSGILIVFITILIVGGTIVITHVGSATQQSILGLHGVYKNSSIGMDANGVGSHLGKNVAFNNSILFVLWGAVGLGVYSIVQGLATELRNTDDLLRELTYVHINRKNILREATSRALIRLAAVAGWWILAFMIIIRKIIPYAIASAHDTADNYTSANDWLHTALAIVLCLLSFHGLVILTRLTLLRPRLFGNEIIDN